MIRNQENKQRIELSCFNREFDQEVLICSQQGERELLIKNQFILFVYGTGTMEQKISFNGHWF